MPAQPNQTIPTVDHKPHAAFFRQSGWLMIAGIGGGLLTAGVHLLSKRIPEAQYSIFGTLLIVTAVMPTMPLQMVFAQQTASALATNRERQLAGMIRLAWKWTFFLWLAAAALVLFFREGIAQRWGLTDPTALWVTLFAVLFSLWLPMFGGVLQGRQDFFWLGWSALLSGVLRVAVAYVLVVSLAAGATGMMVGALVGISLGAVIGIWRSRDLWSETPEPFDGQSLFRQIIPLMFGFGALQFMFTADTLFAKAFFTGDEMAPYVAAGTLSRALLWLVLPLAVVMFPKLVHSNARSEKSNLLGIVLLGTAVLAICGGLGLWLVGPWMVKSFHLFPSSYVEPMRVLLPWYAAAMVPLALANVLINDLMARGRFRAVPVMVLLAAAYGFTLPYILNHFPRTLATVLQTLTVFNLLLLVACAWAAFGNSKTEIQNPIPAV
jgi:O-antigen/teichoic acid export membrane protein